MPLMPPHLVGVIKMIVLLAYRCHKILTSIQIYDTFKVITRT